MSTPRTVIRHRRQAMGLCPECGQRPPRTKKDGNLAYECEECYEARKLLLRTVIRPRLKAEGKCTRCRKPKESCNCRKSAKKETLNYNTGES